MAVDYVALNKQLEAEAAGGTAQLGAPSAQQPLAFVTNAPTDAVAVHASNAAPNQKPDLPMDDTALQVEQQQRRPQQPHEGDAL